MNSPEIESWCDQYSVPKEINVYPDNPPHLPLDVIGQTTHRTRADGTRYSVIDIQQCIPTESVTYTATLWHEFCHAEAWLKYGAADGHGDKWRARLFRKPGLALWDVFVSPFTYTWFSRAR